MPEITNNTYINTKPAQAQQRQIAVSPPPDSGTNIEAHYTDNMKVKRPRIKPENIQINIPAKTLYSDREATKKIQQLNSDIYEGQQKEKSSHEFNFKTYLKICIGFVLAAAAIAGIRKIVRYFKK